MIYTSYFANLRHIPEDIVPIAICGKAPDFYTGLQYKKLAPKFDFFMQWKRDHNNERYIEEFNKKVLSILDADKIVDELAKLSGNATNIALICYEKPNDFCHRHLVAEWLINNGYPCEEYNFGG